MRKEVSYKAILEQWEVVGQPLRSEQFIVPDSFNVDGVGDFCTLFILFGWNDLLDRVLGNPKFVFDNAEYHAELILVENVGDDPKTGKLVAYFDVMGEELTRVSTF